MEVYIIQEIALNGKIIGYVEEAKDVLKYLPSGSPEKFRMTGKTDRELLYGKDLYVITKSDKVVGLESGDICPACRLGVVEDVAGCKTCRGNGGCGSQLKCGL